MLTWMGERISRRRMTVEGRRGCIAAIILGVPVFIFLMTMDIFGDCAPNTACKHGFLTQVLAPSVVIAVSIGLLVRWATKMVRRSGS